MTTNSPVESLLGPPPAPLGLRICGTERNGQVVWLTSPKVTIGSGPRSTLRLRAPGVTPLHCVILRGSQHTVARCWSPDTRLNGAAFETANVQAGDCIGVGALEFKVVERKPEGAEPITTVAAETAASELPATAELSPAPTPLASEIAAARKLRGLARRYRQTRRQARRRIQRLAFELRTMRDKAAELEGRLTQQRNELTQEESQRSEWRACRNVLEAQQSHWVETRTQIERLVSDLSRTDRTAQTIPLPLHDQSEHLLVRERQLAALRERLDAERATWDSDRAAWETELTQRQAALREEAERLDRIQANIERQQSILEEQLETLTRKQQQIESRTEEATRLQQLSEEQRRSVRGEIEKLDLDRAGFRAEQEALAQQRIECEQRARELAESAAKLQQEREQFDAQRMSLDAERGELADQRARLEELDRRLESEKQSVESQLAQMAEAEAQIGHARDELMQARRELEEEISHRAEPSTQPMSRLAEVIASRESDQVDDGNPPSEDTQDVFARLRSLQLIKETDEVAAEPVAFAPSEEAIPVEVEPVQQPTPIQTPPVASDSEGDESIESYMARLLQRVGRGATAEPIAAKSTSETQAKPRTAPEAPADGPSESSESVAEEPQITTLSELHARTAAPEKTRDLAAMREIANFTARTAIAKHAWRGRVVKQFKRFLLGIVALACGVALILLSPTSESHYFLYGMAAVAAALFWFLPSIHRARRCKKQGQRAQSKAVQDYEQLPQPADEVAEPVA